MHKSWLQKLVKSMRCISRSVYDTVMHDGIENAGYLAYLLMLTIFPFLVFFVALLGLFGGEKLSNLLVNLILDSSWASFIDALKPRIIEITSNPPQSFLTIAILSAVWTASSIFEAIRTILNKAYMVVEYPNYISRRLISFLEFAIVIMMTVVLLATLIIAPIVLDYLNKNLIHVPWLHLEFFTQESSWMRKSIIMLFGITLISGLYFFLPNRKQQWLKVLPGAFTVLVGWSWATSGMGWYLITFPSINIIYGSIASVIITLFYFYICALIFIFGAELNANLERDSNSK